jgi:hypothetical protein
VVMPFMKELLSSVVKNFIRLDIAGENKTMANEAKQLGINVEFLSRLIPHNRMEYQNAPLLQLNYEQEATMSHAGLLTELKEILLLAECRKTVIMLSNMIISDVKTSYR